MNSVTHSFYFIFGSHYVRSMYGRKISKKLWVKFFLLRFKGDLAVAFVPIPVETNGTNHAGTWCIESSVIQKRVW